MTPGRRASRALQMALVGAAAAAAVAPLPAPQVERYYADALYPPLQAQLTAWANLTTLSFFDAGVAGVVLLVGLTWGRRLVRARRERSLAPIAGAIGRTVVVAAAAYLWFLLVWGFNYAREPLETVVGYDAARVTPDAVRALAERALQEVNRRHAEAHAAGFPARDAQPPALALALHHVERRLGRPRPTIISQPKRTLLAPFFRASGTDGMHTPLLLETLLNPDLTPPERPAVLAHEWAHLAGYAPEDDASFVGILAALRADPGSRYSGWLSLFHDALGELPAAEQRRLVARLDPGPRADRAAIAARLESRVPFIAYASWLTYDRYLRSQGVSEGVESYSRVVHLIVGSGALEW